MSRIYTNKDILEISRSGRKELVLRPGDRLTDLARDAARMYGVRVVREDGSSRPDRPGASRETDAAERSDAFDILIKGGTCVVPEMGLIRTNVCIRNGKIAALTTDEPAARDVIDASGLYVLPGIIDPHTHLGLFTDLETELVTETRSAILGGVTSIGTYFNQEDGYLPLIRKLRKDVPALSRTDMIPHFSMRTDRHVDEMELYSREGMNSFKVYMCGVTGIYPNQEDGFIVKVMKKMKELPPWANPILSVHCENQSVCDYAADEWSNRKLETLDDWNETHPNLAEGEAVQRTAYFSREIGVRAYIVHSSTRQAMEALKTIKHPGLFVETTSPYLALDTGSDIGAYGKMLPPIREEASRQALWDGIRSGLIDTIGTDNTVMTSSEKNIRGGMNDAGAGYPTLGTHLVSVLNEGIYRQEVMLDKLVPLMTMNPAKIFGVYPRKGTIMPGSDADIVIVDLNSEKVVRPSELLSRSDFSLFQGKKLRAWPKMTIKDGRIAASNGKIVDDTVRGKVLEH